MTNKKLLAAIGSLAVLAAVAIPATSASAANEVNVQKTGCAPDAVVYIVYTLSPKATSEIHYSPYGTNSYGSSSVGFSTAGQVVYNTGLRSVNAFIWSGYVAGGRNLANITSAVAECVG
jgi:hypothetical protein